MIIADFGETLVIDELSYNKRKHKHFISHLFNNEIKTAEVFKSCANIYTSQFIKNILMSDYEKTMPVPHKFIILQPNVKTTILLKNGEKIEVTMFESDEINKNVMFLFGQNSKPLFLYAGICTNIRSIMLFNDTFDEAVQKGIEVLYLDLNLANTTQYTSTFTAAEQLADILYSNPDYKIRLLVPKFGYEEFIESIVKKIPNKILIGLPREKVFKSAKFRCLFAKTMGKARIYIGNSTMTMNTVENIFTKFKNLIVQVIPRNSKIEKYMQSGIYQINWSPHPSPIVLGCLTELVRPNKIIPIAHSEDVYYMEVTIPKYLKKLCKNYVKTTVCYDLCDELVNSCEEGHISLMKHPNRNEIENKCKDIQRWLTEKIWVGEKNWQDQDENICHRYKLRRRTTINQIDSEKMNSENKTKEAIASATKPNTPAIKINEQPPIIPRNWAFEYDDSLSK